jgi:ATP-dependent protease ClpP protease subunit
MNDKPNRARAREIIDTTNARLGRRPRLEAAKRLIGYEPQKSRAFISLDVRGEVNDAMADRVLKQLAGAPKASAIHIAVDSPGGDLRAGIRIADAIKKHPAKRKLGLGTGDVASAAAIVFAAADVRRLLPSARVLLHGTSLDPTSHGRWTRDRYESHAATLAALDESIAARLVERTGAPLSVIEAELTTEAEMPLPKAVSIGLAHEIVGVSPPLAKAWPAAARAALAGRDRYTVGADAHRYSPGFLAACEIAGV